MPRRTLFRQLLGLHALDRQRGDGHALWLFRARVGPWSVNLPRLRLEHPERFGVPSPEELHQQLVEVRDYGRFTRRRVNALISGFRAHRAEHQTEVLSSVGNVGAVPARQEIAQGTTQREPAEPTAVNSEVRLRQASDGKR